MAIILVDEGRLVDVHLKFSKALDTVSWDSFPSGKSQFEGLNLLRCLLFVFFFPFLEQLTFSAVPSFWLKKQVLMFKMLAL